MLTVTNRRNLRLGSNRCQFAPSSRDPRARSFRDQVTVDVIPAIALLHEAAAFVQTGCGPPPIRYRAMNSTSAEVGPSPRSPRFSGPTTSDSDRIPPWRALSTPCQVTNRYGSLRTRMLNTSSASTPGRWVPGRRRASGRQHCFVGSSRAAGASLVVIHDTATSRADLVLALGRLRTVSTLHNNVGG